LAIRGAQSHRKKRDEQHDDRRRPAQQPTEATVKRLFGRARRRLFIGRWRSHSISLSVAHGSVK